ncbi:MAG: hypothetical protein LW832_07775 [Parachlamydia sp.]|jgi:hypothetical protein|nr:hypothetical protein [Parachlamydia sp.]
MDGILIASDETLEWMLPWWWHHYAAQNTLPVAMIDFGLSPEALEWCKQRGKVIPFREPLDFLVPKERIAPELVLQWQALFHNKNFWKVRGFCLKKPLAMLKSPFERTIWTDVDCEIKKPLTPLFDYCETKAGLSLAPQPDFALQHYRAAGLLKPDEKTYNAGVVVFKKDSEVLFKWAEGVREQNACFPGDSDLLAQVIRQNGYTFQELPQIYNWRMAQGGNPEAVIVHWVADRGKQHIREESINFHQLRE